MDDSGPSAMVDTCPSALGSHARIGGWARERLNMKQPYVLKLYTHGQRLNQSEIYVQLYCDYSGIKVLSPSPLACADNNEKLIPALDHDVGTLDMRFTHPS